MFKRPAVAIMANKPIYSSRSDIRRRGKRHSATSALETTKHRPFAFTKQALVDETKALSNELLRDSKNASLYRRVHDNLWRLGRTEELFKLLDSATAALPNWKWPYNVMIMHQLEVKRADLALLTAEKAALKFPNALEFIYEKGRLSERLGHLEESVEYFNQVISLRPLYKNTIFLRDKILEQLKGNKSQRDFLKETAPLKDTTKSFDLDSTRKEVGILEAAKQLIERASPEDRALIAGMALPEHQDIFEAIAKAKQEFAQRRADFAKTPLPKLSPTQISAIKKRAKDRPWAKRADNRRGPFEWVRDNYK
jgi:tetratricopeptide (TPR) repeat protein